MAFGIALLQDHLSNLGNLLDGKELNADASKAVEQKVAGEFSALVNQGDDKNGIVSLTQQLNNATSDIAFGDGVCKLTENVSGQEQNLVTDISSSASDLSTMTGKSVSSTTFRKKYYGGTSTEAISAMLEEGTGQSVEQLSSAVSSTHASKYQGTVRSALTTTLQSILSVAQSNFGNLIKTFVPSSIGNVLEDIADGLDKSGSLTDRIQSLAQGRLTDGQLQDAITFIGNKDKNSAVNIVSSVSDLPVSQIESEVNNMSTSLSDRVTDNSIGSDMPDFVIGSTRDGFDDEFDPNSQFSMVNSYEALEADFRNATRDITEIVLHWSESAANQFLTAQDIHEIQGGIRYHYCILRDGRIQKGLSINKIGNHIPTAVVANRVAKVQSNPSTAAVKATRVPVGGEETPKGQHNTYSIGVCIIGGIAQAAHNLDYAKYLSSKSFTSSQWDTIDGMLKTFFKVFPGGQAFGHNDIENNETDPGFNVPYYVRTKFQKTSTDGVAKSTTEINSQTEATP